MGEQTYTEAALHYTIKIPGSVWYDTLDPNVSGMEKEIGLPAPQSRKVGKGEQFIYENVTAEQAEDVAEYLGDRGEMLLGQGYRGMSEDPEEMRSRNIYRAAIKTAAKIRQQVKHA